MTLEILYVVTKGTGMDCMGNTKTMATFRSLEKAEAFKALHSNDWCKPNIWKEQFIVYDTVAEAEASIKEE